MSFDIPHGLHPFWMVFSLSFLVALTGAMSPGPLLTYTIVKAIRSRERGFLMGFWIILGHALVEMAIIAVLLLGFSFVLTKPAVVRGIGVTGSLVLIYFGATLVRGVLRGEIPTDFIAEPAAGEPGPAATRKGIDNPVLGGMAVSMANPYWWVWWATIGLAFMVQFEISLANWQTLVAFFLGHETGDLLWYAFVSTAAFLGRRHLSRKAYYGILAGCGLFLIGFGVYLGVSPFFKAV